MCVCVCVFWLSGLWNRVELPFSHSFIHSFMHSCIHSLIHSVCCTHLHSHLDYANSVLYGISPTTSTNSSVVRTWPPASFCGSQVPALLLFSTSWTGFTGSNLSSDWLQNCNSDLQDSGHLVYLRQLISPYQPSHSLWSSNQLLLTVPHTNLTVGQRAFSYSSPVIWNAIPLRDAPSVSSSKHRLQSFYFHSIVS